MQTASGVPSLGAAHRPNQALQPTAEESRKCKGESRNGNSCHVAWFLVAWVCAGFGLAVPRLRNANFRNCFCPFRPFFLDKIAPAQARSRSKRADWSRNLVSDLGQYMSDESDTG